MNEPMVTDEPTDGQKPVPSAELVDEFEMAFQVSKLIYIFPLFFKNRIGLRFQKCLTVLEKPEAVERMTSEEMRSAVDNNILRFIELGRNLETFFLKKRFLISQNQPEQILKEVLYFNLALFCKKLMKFYCRISQN